LESTDLRRHQRPDEQYPIEFSTGSSAGVDRGVASIPRVSVHRQESAMIKRRRSLMQTIDRNY